MRTLLAISPHLDDAIFSAGGTIAQASRRGWRTIIATVFTGNVAQPTGFALACQLDKDLPAEVDYMALRRDEDVAACALVGAEALHLPFLEAPHRGYDSAPALFADVRTDDEARTSVTDGLRDVIRTIGPNRLLTPLGLGGHVDHLIVRDAVRGAAPDEKLWLWEDWPYIERLASRDRSRAHRIDFDESERASKVEACAAYQSQLGFQFGGAEELREKLSKQSGEWFHADARTATL